MSAPTARQTGFFNDLVNNEDIMRSLTPGEVKLIDKARRPDAVFGDLSVAITFLRDRRDELRQNSGVEPIATPENTYGQRCEREKNVYTELAAAVETAQALASVVRQPLSSEDCAACGHFHTVEMDCAQVISSAGGQYETCDCRFWCEPDDEQVLAYEAQQRANELEEFHRQVVSDRIEARPGDMFFINRANTHNPETEGIFLRAQPTSKGLAYLLRVPAYNKDVWVPKKNVDRTDYKDHTFTGKPALTFSAA